MPSLFEFSESEETEPAEFEDGGQRRAASRTRGRALVLLLFAVGALAAGQRIGVRVTGAAASSPPAAETLETAAVEGLAGAELIANASFAADLVAV